jgi:EAL and modified HD-GYP domain-containing signal transduction protein
MSSVFVARQPIFELDRGLVGYELLYRADAAVAYANGDRDTMSAGVIVASLLDVGLDEITGGATAFVNFSRCELTNETWSLFDPADVVIELLEHVECNQETLAACGRLVQAGYRLALDDYVYSDATRPLLDLASIIKVDVLGQSQEQLARIAKQLTPSGARLLAERVETATVRDVCADLGYELFQGYLFSRPETLTKGDVAVGQLATLRLLNLLRDPSTTDAALDSAFQSDLALCYKLLRIVNAAAVGGRGITSIQHAVRLVGRETLHRWLAVLFVASLGQKGNVTHEMALTAITRARMCEVLANNSPRQMRAGSAFIVGLLSLLDVLLEVPMDEIVGRLELSDDVRGALLQRGGPLGMPLKLVEAYETADWALASGLAFDNAVANEALPEIYLGALRWATQQMVV